MVKSAQRVIDILEVIAGAPHGLGMSELARRLSIPKSSTWNLAQTLLERGYVEQDAAGHFVLGPRLFDVGVCARADIRLRTVARPVMTELMEWSGETVFLGVLTPDLEVVQLDKVVSPHVIRYDAEVGEKRPAHCTAMGQVLLAHLPPRQLHAYVRRRRFQRFTPRTVTTGTALLRKLEQIRQAGVALNIEERVPGASAVGAAIRAGDVGRAIAGIIVAGPTGRIVARREALLARVKDAASRISRALQEEMSGSHGVAQPGRPPAEGRRAERGRS
jgi:IclR family KDG regulon transcriptional repressor